MTALEMTKREMRTRARALVLHQRASVKPPCHDDRAGLLEAVRKWAAEVHCHHDPVHVFLFGSLASGDLWHSTTSDIDLAVVGLRELDYWHAWKRAEELIPGRRIDLVDLEMATKSLRDSVEQTGIAL